MSKEKAITKEDRTEATAKSAMEKELSELETALDNFLSGEVRDGLITAFKLTLIVHAKTLLAVAERSRKDVAENKVRID